MDDNVSSASYTNTSVQQVQQPGYNHNNIQQQFLNTTQPITQNIPHFIQNNSNSSPFNTSQIDHFEILTFEIPGIKIIIIPTFPPMLNSSRTNHSEIFTFDIPGSKVIIITLSF
ncbi:hypothetical protein RhiirC2_767532 [Rhizophagus irregularis]|uniref:Uncharacterized protein n=1 Tax=Rhizophagus irregularis TaxID=588596 RepID=A0A2N1P3Y3_9GLOM|nr:hypothetical protein RhiirC2_767532 [Rhizophagus irregularis]